MTAIAANQRYTIADREYVRADLRAVQQTIDYWDGKVKELSASASACSRSRSRRIVHGW